ncbi:MAG: Na+/H+ antiporter subunit B [Anaerolineae bacterium]|nr:Na+/H+ antiporter subunit B [Anaerolineae bacterium]
MIALLFSGILLSILFPLLNRHRARLSYLLLLVYPLLVSLYLIRRVNMDNPIAASLPWVPSLEISLSFRLDGLSLIFSLLISAIGFLILVYAGEYLRGYPLTGRFFSFLTLFMTSMLGLVWADNLITLFVFWELTSITSYLLIGYDHEDQQARKAALQALLITAGGGLALLAGLVLMGQAAGTFEISQINQKGQLIRESNLYPLILLAIFAGAFTKSAQFPFHFWLPGAMAAPTPVSAYLHSATMVKAGIYLLARLYPALAGTEAWQYTLLGVGLITFLAGSLLALPQTDLKKILAYSTVAALGLLVMLLGIGSGLAVKTAVVYLFAHSLYKGGLFLVAGGVDHAVHTRQVDQLGGLGKAMPLTAFGAALCGLSAIGFIPTLGFVAKELVYELILAFPQGALLTALAVLAFTALTAVSGWVFALPFWQKNRQKPLQAHENSSPLWGPPALLGMAGILLAVFIPQTGSSLIGPAVESILSSPQPVTLKLWHGLTPMFVLSLFTILAGALVYTVRIPFQRAIGGLHARLSAIGPQRLFDLGLEGLKKFAVLQTRILQNGYLRIYLITIILTTVALTGINILKSPGGLDLPAWQPPRFYDVVLAGVVLAAVLAVVSASSRLATVAILGLIGFTIALIYLLFGAPDLAMVQFAIETLAVILFILVIYRLPKFARITSRPARMLDILVALSGGALVTLLVLWITSRPFTSHLTPYFVENSLPLAKGRNVVNVILVDFRALDTLGEISVLAIAAIGVFALVELNLDKSLFPSQRALINKVRSMILPTAVRYLMPLLLIFSVFLLLRGHNEVGGGFVGGLVAASALMLYAIAVSPQALLRLLPASPRHLIGLGLLVALASGALGIFQGLPYMTGLWLSDPLPVFGKIGSPVLFDVGVFIAVIGVSLHILIALAEDGES